jgi:hypothetical protein
MQELRSFESTILLLTNHICDWDKWIITHASLPSPILALVKPKGHSHAGMMVSGAYFVSSCGCLCCP